MHIQTRKTKQTEIVLNAAKKMGHASNAQLLQIARELLPNLSATSVHRITKRLIERNLLSKGPEINGIMLVDSNVTPHDHFVCSGCGGVKDLNVSEKLRSELRVQLGVEILPSTLLIFGGCKRCVD